MNPFDRNKIVGPLTPYNPHRGRRESFQLTNTNPARPFSLDWSPNTLSITNNSKFAVYVNIGSTSKPTAQSFQDVIAPFSSYVAAPEGARDFSINVDNASDPATPFNFPVVITFSSGPASTQSPISSLLTSTTQAAWINKILNIEKPNLIDFWVLDDTALPAAIDRIAVARNGAYVGSPTLGGALGPDGLTRCPVLNGTTQYVNLFSAGVQGAISLAEGSLLVYTQMPVSAWGDANTYMFAELFTDAANVAHIMKAGAAPNAVHFQWKTTSNNPAITPTNNFFGWMMTWSTTGNRVRQYANGAQLAGSGGPMVAWAGALAKFTVGASDVPSQFLPGNPFGVALWTVELTVNEAIAATVAP